MKYYVTAVRDLALILKDLEPYIRDPRHLRTGRDLKKMAMRPRELLGNWLFCVVLVYATGRRWTLSEDPTGGDGAMLDRDTGTGFLTEHVFIPPPAQGKKSLVEQQIANAIAAKAKKGAGYARGRSLVVFSEAIGPFFPNRIGSAIAGTNAFEAVWAMGLESAIGGQYAYWVTRLEPDHAPAWRVALSKEFDAWTVTPVQ
jgi:hypothetical protein